MLNTRAYVSRFIKACYFLPSRTGTMAEAQYFQTPHDMPLDFICCLLSLSALLLSFILPSVTRMYWAHSGLRTFEFAVLLAGSSSSVYHPSSHYLGLTQHPDTIFDFPSLTLYFFLAIISTCQVLCLFVYCFFLLSIIQAL